MELAALLDRLEELMSHAPRVPLTGKALVDPEEVLALLDQIRDAFPREFDTARRVAEERDRILREARSEAEQVLQQTRVHAGQLIDETTIARDAHAHAEELVEQAKRVAREIKVGAREYAHDVLAKVETDLMRTIEAIRRGREELQR